MTQRYASPVEEVIAGMDSWNDVDRVPGDLVRYWRGLLSQHVEPSGLLSLLVGVVAGALGAALVLVWL